MGLTWSNKINYTKTNFVSLGLFVSLENIINTIRNTLIYI